LLEFFAKRCGKTRKLWYLQQIGERRKREDTMLSKERFLTLIVVVFCIGSLLYMSQYALASELRIVDPHLPNHLRGSRYLTIK
jgi:hypothetical protein